MLTSLRALSVTLSAVVLATLFPPGGATSDEYRATGPGWTQFQADSEHSGLYSGSTRLGPATAANTRQLWSVAVDGGVIAQPVGAAGTVYAGTPAGSFVAVDQTSGLVRWTRKLDPVYGAAAVLGTSVIVGTHVSSNEGQVYALDVATGATKWSRRLTGGVLFPPIIVRLSTVSSTMVVIADQGGSVGAYRGGSGKPIWTRRICNCGVESIVVRAGMVYASAMSNVTALSAATGEISWSVSVNGFNSNTRLAAADGAIYGGGSFDYVALDPGDGHVLWRANSDGDGFALAMPAIREGRLFVASDSSTRVYAIDASNGAVIWRRSWDAVAPKGPIAAANGILVISDSQQMILVSEVDGTLLKRIDLPDGGPVVPAPAISGSLVLRGSWEAGPVGHLYGYRAR